MICEMEYAQITIKEFYECALINRKTFYLHYQELDQLLQILRVEIEENFIQREISYQNMEDISSIIREFFKYAAPCQA